LLHILHTDKYAEYALWYEFILHILHIAVLHILKSYCHVLHIFEILCIFFFVMNSFKLKLFGLVFCKTNLHVLHI
jgi:hypothetical protein